MFVETKTKINTNIQYRDWRTLYKHGSILNQNNRGGALVQAANRVNIGKNNPPHFNNPWNDVLHFTVPFNNEKIHIFLVYIHHSSQLVEENLLVKASQYKYCIILGDFNVNIRRKTQINNFLKNSDFIRINTPPTFLMENNPDSTPDLLMCTRNIKDNIQNVSLTPDLGSDHLGIEFSLDTKKEPEEYTQETKSLYDKCNTEEVNRRILELIDPQAEITPEYISFFHNTLSKIIIEETPTLKKQYFSQTLPPYIIRLIRWKKQLYREYQTNQEPSLKQKINKLNREIHNMILQFRSNKYLEACKEIEDKEGRTYWRTIKKLSKYTTHQLSHPIQVNGETLIKDKDIADAFAKHFEKLYRKSTNKEFDEEHRKQIENWYLHDLPHIPPDDTIEPISEEEYYTALNHGKNTTPGYDNIPRKILRKLDPSVHNVIIKIYNYCLSHSLFPNEWKKGILITIPKTKTDHSNIENYRPITLLPTLGKNFEKILGERISKETGKYIPTYQFGFKKKTSTIHPLTILTSNFQCNRKMGNKTATLFMDIQKAFDSVWHAGLIFKLFHLKCPTYLIKIIENFLINRKLQVRVKNKDSEEIAPAQGLPQGSPLSPLLYNLFCGDMYRQFNDRNQNINKHAYILQFADDTTLISHQKTLNECMEELQKLADVTVAWMRRWRIQPNPAKSKLIIFNHKINFSSPKIKLGNETITPTDSCKYLGIRIDHKLNFRAHFNLQKKSAITRAGHFRSLTYKNMGISSKTASMIYKMICRPLLEYGLPIFSNATKTALSMIEVAERTCLRKITKLRHPNNPLYNPSNQLLYQITEIEPILERMQKLCKKFITNRNNINVIEPLIHHYNEETTPKAKLPALPLLEHLKSIEAL